MAVLSLLSQGCLNIILSAQLLQSITCYIKHNNNTGDCTTYSTVGVLLHNNVFTLCMFFFTMNIDMGIIQWYNAKEKNIAKLVILTRNTMD